MRQGHWQHSTGCRTLALRLMAVAFLWMAGTGGATGTEPGDGPEPFPRILTLGQALSMLGDDDPALRLGKARMATNRAARARLDDRNALSASLRLDLRAADRIATSGHDFTNESRAILTLDKPLTRFGTDAALYASVETGAEAISARQDRNRAEARHEVLRAYFGVILADFDYEAQDEVMTLSFLAFRNQRDRMEKYNEVAAVEVHRLEAVYLDEFAERTRLRLERRASRLQLAVALNRADAYPDRLVEPDLAGYDRETPDYDEVLARVLENSAEMRIARLETEAARKHLEGLSAGPGPVLGSRFEAAEYRFRTPATRDQFRASVYLEIPLGGKGKRRGEILAASARVLELEARNATVEHDLRVEVLRLVQRLAHLDTELRAAEADLLYSELDLDRVRLLYEMEVRTRIGTANAAVAAAIHRLADARYQRALAWDRLDILMNNEPVQFQ